MIGLTARKLSPHWRRLLVLSFSMLLLAGCGQEPEPELTATTVPVSAPTQAANEPPSPTTPVQAAALAPTPEGSQEALSGPPPTPTVAAKSAQNPAGEMSGAAPSPTTAPTLSPAPVNTSTPPPLPFLDLLFPQDGSILEVAAVRVLGNTETGAAATVNGTAVEVQAGGRFQLDLALDVGLNKINVEVTDSAGRSDSRSVAVFVVPAAAPLPFNLFYPRDGIEVRQRDLPVSGVTKPDAVVLVNGIPVEVNALGIYSGVVSLQDDTNLIEVVATDIFGNLVSETLAVFYTP